MRVRFNIHSPLVFFTQTLHSPLLSDSVCLHPSYTVSFQEHKLQQGEKWLRCSGPSVHSSLLLSFLQKLKNGIIWHDLCGSDCKNLFFYAFHMAMLTGTLGEAAFHHFRTVMNYLRSILHTSVKACLKFHVQTPCFRTIFGWTLRVVGFQLLGSVKGNGNAAAETHILNNCPPNLLATCCRRDTRGCGCGCPHTFGHAGYALERFFPQLIHAKHSPLTFTGGRSAGSARLSGGKIWRWG